MKPNPIEGSRAPARTFRAGTLGSWLDHLGESLTDPDWIPLWPPDAFAVTAAFLQRTGGYVELMNAARQPPRVARRRRKAEPTPTQVGDAWRDALTAALHSRTRPLRETCPPQIAEWWNTFRSRLDEQLTAARNQHGAITVAAWKLCAAADVASVGIGVQPANDNDEQTDDPFLAMAQLFLLKNQQRSFCSAITPDALAVLGKQHTPQRGCTIRALSHNLALYTPREIVARWFGPYRKTADTPEVVNLLLLPWPTVVRADDFTVSRDGDGHPDGPLVDAYRYFDYSPRRELSRQQVAAAVRRALRGAREYADEIHGIVFPELALNPSQFDAVERVAISARAMLIAGIRMEPNRETGNTPRNLCALQPIGLTTAADDRTPPRRTGDEFLLTQFKHHRWCLDRDQILQYELGGRLPVSHDCWERMTVEKRRVNFVTLGSWLTVCALICEDLARQDPVSEVIRAVGPNLVFALLMDGPQLRKRWPARYASVLAEDPGCSVLTLTSLGMALRSRRRNTEKDSDGEQNRTIALWRDAIFGEQEITVGLEDNACVLSLACRSIKEHTIDGRTDNGQAHFPVFAGAHPFAVSGPLA